MSQEQPKPQPPLSPSSSFQAVLKAQSIKALRGTIGVLQGVVEKLEAEPPASTTPSSLDKLQTGSRAALAKIRSLLPFNLSSLSDTALTGIIALVAVIVVWATSALLPGKSPIVASVPPSEQVPTANITTPPELTAPAEAQPVEIAPPPEPEPTPTPTVELTPEQNLIASIQNQIAEITDRFADGLIQSIQVNFQGSSLTIKVGNDWYNLKQSQQDKLATRMFERARELDFSHLEITDPQGTLLARSPVVGTEMVILKRQVLSEQESVSS